MATVQTFQKRLIETLMFKIYCEFNYFFSVSNFYLLNVTVVFF